MALKLKKCNVSELAARLGGLSCDERQVLGFILMDRSVRLDPSTFSKTILDGFIQQDKVIGTIKFDTAEDANVEPSFTDVSTGERIQNNIGMKRWNFTFYKGSCFQNELYKLNNNERYSVLFVFDDGSILGQLLKDGKVKGFDVKLFTGVKNIKTAAEGGGSMLSMDLTRIAMSAWQGSSAVYESDEIDFLELNPVAALDIDVPALVAGATTTVVNISNLCSDSAVTGLTTAASWKVRRNGTLEAVTAVSAVAGTYTFTHGALVADDVISFETYVTGYPIYILDTNYYYGKSADVTVTA